MCKIDRILSTEVRDFNQGAPAGRKMTRKRIRYNTDVVFAVAKQIEMPLDKTVDLMLAKDELKRVYKSFSQRDTVSVDSVAKQISLALQ